MKIIRSSVENAVIEDMFPSEQEGKTTLHLDKPQDKEFVGMYGKRGLNVDVSNSHVESLGLEVGSHVDFDETTYADLSAARYEEVHETPMPKRMRAYILTEMVNRMEACDKGLISPRKRDEIFVVVDEHISLAKENVKTEEKGLSL